jgi:hypothetical protein
MGIDRLPGPPGLAGKIKLLLHMVVVLNPPTTASESPWAISRVISGVKDPYKLTD